LTVCRDAWESLRGDPLAWLLDPQRPNLHWRVLLELVKRPPASPAVLRARGGSNATEPVASLIADLHPDGSWATELPLWRLYSGPGWRFLAAVQWGADPSDPRLQAAAEMILETAPGEGGFARRDGGQAVPWLTARVLQGLAELGWCHHQRFQEGLAWLEEGDAGHRDGGWRCWRRQMSSGECDVTPVALLAALTVCGDRKRTRLRDRATASIIRIISNPASVASDFGHPCLGRTDESEILWSLAKADTTLDPAMVPVLGRLQSRQSDGGRWRRTAPIPRSLGVVGGAPAGEPSRWVTLKCVTALMSYAVDAGLPRMYPQKPVPPTRPVISNQ
jgi:hypothetical protein